MRAITAGLTLDHLVIPHIAQGQIQSAASTVPSCALNIYLCRWRFHRTCSTSSEHGHGKDSEVLGFVVIKMQLPVFQFVPVSCDKITEQDWLKCRATGRVH